MPEPHFSLKADCAAARFRRPGPPAVEDGVAFYDPGKKVHELVSLSRIKRRQ
jgi:hypothetical protein